MGYIFLISLGMGDIPFPQIDQIDNNTIIWKGFKRSTSHLEGYPILSWSEQYYWISSRGPFLILPWNKVKPYNCKIIHGGRGHWTVNCSDTQRFTTTLTYSLALKLWILFINLINRLQTRCIQTYQTIIKSTDGMVLFIIIWDVYHLSYPLLSLEIIRCVFTSTYLHGLSYSTIEIL